MRAACIKSARTRGVVGKVVVIVCWRCRWWWWWWFLCPPGSTNPQTCARTSRRQIHLKQPPSKSAPNVADNVHNDTAACVCVWRAYVSVCVCAYCTLSRTHRFSPDAKLFVPPPPTHHPHFPSHCSTTTPHSCSLFIMYVVGVAGVLGASFLWLLSATVCHNVYVCVCVCLYVCVCVTSFVRVRSAFVCWDSNRLSWGFMRQRRQLNWIIFKLYSIQRL